MNEDRKRFYISLGAALVLHLVILILTGMHSLNFEPSSEFGPLTVEVSLVPQPPVTPPEKEPEPIDNFSKQTAPPAADELPEKVPLPEPKPAPVPKARPSTVSAAAPISAVNTAPAVDDDFLASIKQNRDDISAVNARQAFGDDPVAPETDRPDTWAATGATDGSKVVLSDAPAPEPGTVSSSSAPEQTNQPLIDSGMFSSLDESLEAGTNSDNFDENAQVRPSSAVQNSFSGRGTTLEFKDPSLSRELLVYPPPEIPEDVKKAGIPRYTVVIEFDIDPDGVISGIVLKKSSTNSRIDTAVQAALRRWVFAESESLTDKKVRATLTYVIEIK